MLKRAFVITVAAAALAGCQTIPQNEGKPATVADVVTQIKKDLGEYQRYDAQAAAAKPLPNTCGGAVGFDITSVKVALTTQTDNTLAGTGTATLPVGGATLLPTFGASNEVKGTQTLTFSLYPKPATAPRGTASPARSDPAQYPLAASLEQLREGLLEASKTAPCFSLIPLPDGDKPATDDGGTFVFGFTVINQNTAGATIKFVVFSLGATATSQRQAGNTITVTFKARPGSAAAF